jgi:hypothetical protein
MTSPAILGMVFASDTIFFVWIVLKFDKTVDKLFVVLSSICCFASSE